eukprot:TRINITY_DN26108_c0_g4_i2.p1 TRINITY_DN26108_c0_g4~~TRINITY_DN26108_c0_g4_i2.p1  ORF type:complete len:1017 (-),score=227.47 TRINITY_DN26108_c0_g4_i2:220-3270(-)
MLGTLGGPSPYAIPAVAHGGAAGAPGAAEGPRWRGRIAVSCRIRPLLEAEVAAGARPAPWVITDRSVALGRSRSAGRPSTAPVAGRELGERNTAMTVVDAVFGERSTTREVYERAFRGIVAGAAEGLNGAIMAYGQTCSGKTYSMSGASAQQRSVEDDAAAGAGAGGAAAGGLARERAYSDQFSRGERGIIHFALEDLFSQLRNKEAAYGGAGGAACSYSVSMSYCELYMERVRDLLREGAPQGQHLPVKEDPETRSFYVEGLHERSVNSAEEVITLLGQAEKRRRVACTRYNEVSSRSHTLMTILIEYSVPLSSSRGSTPVSSVSRGETPRVTRVGRLVFVDLAGNERVEAGPEYMAETNSINKSLFFLGKVIERLARGCDADTMHLPVRDSNLTRLLAMHLGGNSRTGLLVTLTPSRDAIEESLSTLRFAQKASTIRSVAHPVFTTKEQQLLMRQQETIAQLHSQVQELRECRMHEWNATGGAACRMVQRLREENSRLRSSIRFIVAERDRERSGSIVAAPAGSAGIGGAAAVDAAGAAVAGVPAAGGAASASGGAAAAGGAREVGSSPASAASRSAAAASSSRRDEEVACKRSDGTVPLKGLQRCATAPLQRPASATSLSASVGRESLPATTPAPPAAAEILPPAAAVPLGAATRAGGEDARDAPRLQLPLGESRGTVPAAPAVETRERTTVTASTVTEAADEALPSAPALGVAEELGSSLQPSPAAQEAPHLAPFSLSLPVDLRRRSSAEGAAATGLSAAAFRASMHPAGSALTASRSAGALRAAVGAGVASSPSSAAPRSPVRRGPRVSQQAALGFGVQDCERNAAGEPFVGSWGDAVLAEAALGHAHSGFASASTPARELPRLGEPAAAGASAGPGAGDADPLRLTRLEDLCLARPLSLDPASGFWPAAAAAAAPRGARDPAGRGGGGAAAGSFGACAGSPARLSPGRRRPASANALLRRPSSAGGSGRSPAARSSPVAGGHFVGSRPSRPRSFSAGTLRPASASALRRR